MNSHLLSLFIVLTPAALMQGCFFFDALFYEEGSYESYDYGYEAVYVPDPVEASHASLGGDFGTPSANLPATVEGSTEGAWTGIDILSVRDDEALMAMVDVWGGLESIPTGGVQTYDRYDDGSEGHVSVVGCAGPEPYLWTRDQAAEYVEVRATANPDDPTLRTYQFRAHFPSTTDDTSPGGGGASTLTGRFIAP